MAKKKRKKNSKGIFSLLGGLVHFSFMLFLKTVPFFVLAALGGALYAGVRGNLSTDPGLLVQRIALEPAGALSPTEISRLENEWIGKNIFKIPLKTISMQIEKDPAVLKAVVTKQFPSTLAFQVERRKPLAYLKVTANAPTAVVSEDGVILEISAERNVSGLIVEAFGLGIAHPSIGMKIRQPAFLQAAQFLKKYEKMPLSHYEPVTKLMLDRLGNVSIILGPGPEVRLGRRPLERLDSLEKAVALLAGNDRSKIDYIDLQFGNVVAKQKRGTA